MQKKETKIVLKVVELFFYVNTPCHPLASGPENDCPV